jgi:sodium transport system permease protein
MSGLRSFGKWPAILVAALLFGVAHASIYRLLPTACLGVVLGYAAWQSRSVFASAILHMLNNGLAITIAREPSLGKALGISSGSVFMPWPQVFAFGVVMLAGLAILRSKPSHEINISV